MTILLRLTAVAWVGSVALPAHAASNLVVNGGFETPVLPANSPKLYALGEEIDGWSVIGAGDVAVLNGSFSQAGLTFTHQEGEQSLDLTGLSNTAAGISQWLATTPGAVYDLGFYVGNVQSTGPVWGTTSAVRVRVGGVDLARASFSGGPSGSLGWQRFDYQFTAAAASTELAFFNLDGPSDNVNQIDAVSVVTTAVPEPSSVALFVGGLVWLGRRRIRSLRRAG